MAPSSYQRPDQPLRDYVLPLALFKRTEDSFKLLSIQGTGFLIENGRGLGVTARHVSKDCDAGAADVDVIAAVMFVPPEGGWVGVSILRFERHPTEDVALFRLPDDDYESPYSFTDKQYNAPAHYALWGYPEDVLHDRMKDGGLSPDLVYSEGHIRRRRSYELANSNRVPGKAFYELSTPAGHCCSGAPVSEYGSAIFQVLGVYVGEWRNESGTLAVGYASRAESLKEKWPALFTGGADLSKLCTPA